MLYHTEHQYRYSGYHQYRDLLWLCVLCAAEAKDTEHAMLPVFILDIQMHLTIAVTTPIYFDTRV